MLTNENLLWSVAQNVLKNVWIFPFKSPMFGFYKLESRNYGKLVVNLYNKICTKPEDF